MYDLPCLVLATRRRRKLSLRAAAAKIGCDHHTLHRVEGGGGCHIGTLIFLLDWMEQD